ncbi:MAG: hypothetical protein AUG16_05185 [Thaumarchaeota archaeon 13_1_20CM_2_39_20]|nr:MAG: hypothetical protein AUI59_02535 [Thaumarchaeota archaeon 13_1_40CM_2_39_13_1]OLE40223.1 MAG: hypothetical protein AUG16_05185 [Thaumarchaeota archaeon 13_1_20CM_2_39_20]
MKLEIGKPQFTSIYDYDDRIERTYKIIEKETSKENVELIKKYDRSMIAESLAKATRHKHLQVILNLTRFLGKDWKDVTKEDVENVVVRIVQEYCSDSGQETNTSYDHKKILKIFFRWFKFGSRKKEEVGDPQETKGVKIKKVKDKIVREDLVTEEDRTNLLQVCADNLRDRAFIDCHSEAGTRPGEILSLLLKHVKFDKYGALIHVDGKTGPRPIRLVRSTPNLASWIDAHPFRDNPNAPLWISTEPSKFGRQLTYHAAYQMVRRRCRQAKLPKRVYLNLFRHSEDTQTAQFMTEVQMRKRHGWTPYSKMPGRYVHLVNADVDRAILSHLGIVESDESKPKLPKKCGVCEMHNPPESKLCTKCGKPLDIEVALEIEEKHEAEKIRLEKRLSEVEARHEDLRKLKEEFEEDHELVQNLNSAIEEIVSIIKDAYKQRNSDNEQNKTESKSENHPSTKSKEKIPDWVIKLTPEDLKV